MSGAHGEARAYGRERREYTFKHSTGAAPEDVYDTLADLSSHLEWGGRRQWGMFRLLSLAAPPGPATAGTTFTSQGKLPMIGALSEDESEVTEAARPVVFEVTTQARIRWPERPHGQATIVHRYEIAPRGSGSAVTYRMRQLAFKEPPWGLRWPLLRSVTARVWVPIWCGRGFRNLLRSAARREGVLRPSAGL